MSEQNRDTLRCDPQDLRQCMSIHTRKITDSCRDKDCIEDLRVYLTTSSQAILDTTANTRVRSAELLTTYIDVEPVAFDGHRYCIDVTFYYRILADATVGASRPAALYGLAVFNKRAVLCGEDSCAHIYRSDTRIGDLDGQTILSANRPTAVVEVLDPMVLSSKVRDICDCPCTDSTAVQIPCYIQSLFDEELVLCGEQRRLLVTLGQFSIIRLERETELLIPVYDYCIPEKECCCSGGGITPLTATETVSAEAEPRLTITKSVSPTTVTENGQLTYTFVIQNTGNVLADATDAVVVTDTFDPILTGLTVTYNGTPWTSPASYTYNEATGLFSTAAGSITVPAATYTQDPTTGAWVVDPGVAVLTVTGTI